MENSMNPIEKKIEAMKKYKRSQFLYNLVLYSLTTLITFLFVSYPFWLPTTKHFFLVSLPENLSCFFDAKCFFVLGNIIVFILVRESRVATRSSNLLTASDIYDAYVVRSKSFRSETINGDDQRGGRFVKGLNLEEKRIENEKNREEIKMMRACEITRDEKVVKRMRKVDAGGTKKVDDLSKIPMEELNKRVEAFIQRVNRQRSLENY